MPRSVMKPGLIVRHVSERVALARGILIALISCYGIRRPLSGNRQRLLCQNPATSPPQAPTDAAQVLFPHGNFQQSAQEIRSIDGLHRLAQRISTSPWNIQ